MIACYTYIKLIRVISATPSAFSCELVSRPTISLSKVCQEVCSHINPRKALVITNTNKFGFMMKDTVGYVGPWQDRIPVQWYLSKCERTLVRAARWCNLIWDWAKLGGILELVFRRMQCKLLKDFWGRVDLPALPVAWVAAGGTRTEQELV